MLFKNVILEKTEAVAGKTSKTPIGTQALFHKLEVEEGLPMRGMLKKDISTEISPKNISTKVEEILHQDNDNSTLVKTQNSYYRISEKN